MCQKSFPENMSFPLKCQKKTSYTNKEWCSHPAYSPVQSRIESEHRFNVFTESLNSIKPTNSDHFTHNYEKNGEGYSISVQKWNYVGSTLKIVVVVVKVVRTKNSSSSIVK